MPFVRSMNLSERSQYETTVRQWFPNVELEFKFQEQNPGATPGDIDTNDPVRARFYRNGTYVEVTIVDQLVVYDENGGTYPVYGAEQFRFILRDAIVASPEVMFPLMMDDAPSFRSSPVVTSGDASVASVTRVPPTITRGKA